MYAHLIMYTAYEKATLASYDKNDHNRIYTTASMLLLIAKAKKQSVSEVIADLIVDWFGLSMAVLLMLRSWVIL